MPSWTDANGRECSGDWGATTFMWKDPDGFYRTDHPPTWCQSQMGYKPF